MDNAHIYEAIGQAHVLAHNYALVAQKYTEFADRLAGARAILDSDMRKKIVLKIFDEMETFGDAIHEEAPL